MVYSAAISMEDETKIYIGQTNNTFRKRLGLHESDTNCGRTRCALSAYLIDQKKKGKEPESIQWSMIKPIKPRGRGDRYCNLCLSEKVFILRGNQDLLLNKRSELMQRCRHRDRLMLENFYSITSKRERAVGRRQGGMLLRIEEEEEEGEDTGGPEEERVEYRRMLDGGPVEGGTEEEGGLEGGGLEEGELERRGPEDSDVRRLRARSRLDYRMFF